MAKPGIGSESAENEVTNEVSLKREETDQKDKEELNVRNEQNTDKEGKAMEEKTTKKSAHEKETESLKTVESQKANVEPTTEISKKRKTEEEDTPKKAKQTQQEIVADHYNKREVFTVETRQQTKTFNLRKFNNWVKAVLINIFVRNGDRVLDLGCGKGGDVMKWTKAQVSQVVGIDIAEQSIEEARKRSAEARLNSDFIVGNPFKTSLTEIYDGSLFFNAVSCQFAFHYAFESELSLKTALKNISTALSKDGVFFCTVPYYREILKRIGNSLECANEFYKIRFETKPDPEVLGAKYFFTLEEALDDCPEYLVNPYVLEKYAEEFNLKIMSYNSFPDFFNANHKRYKDLLYKMKVLHPLDLKPSEREVIGNLV